MTDNPDWSAFYLWKDGELVTENAARCPQTMKRLDDIPLARTKNRSPSVLFSLLRPGARIPPHSGLVNTRLICHLPLIVPQDCGFRVGNDTRTPIEGKAWVFDDTMEHEAWNRSDRTRVILLFEIWRPEFTEEERGLVAQCSRRSTPTADKSPRGRSNNRLERTMQNIQERFPEINALEAQAVRAAQTGREDEATQALESDPRDRSQPFADLDGARPAPFPPGDMHRPGSRSTASSTPTDRTPSNGFTLPSPTGTSTTNREESAIQRALSLDPTDLVALLLRANLLERKGKTHDAAQAFGAAAAVAPPLDRIHPELRPAVAEALAHVDKYNKECAAFLDQYLEPQLAQFAGENLQRFRDSLDIMVGRKRRYDSHSMTYHYPHLAPIEFFDRADFPWLDPIEAGTDSSGKNSSKSSQPTKGSRLHQYPPDVPRNQFAELNNSPRWSAFHLSKLGKLVQKTPRSARRR